MQRLIWILLLSGCSLVLMAGRCSSDDSDEDVAGQAVNEPAAEGDVEALGADPELEPDANAEPDAGDDF